MIKTLIGIVLFLIPFLWILKFRYWKLGFFYVLSFMIGFELVVALITQLFGIFNYGVVLGLHILLAGFVLFKTDWSLVEKCFKKIRVDWVFLFVVLILILSLFSVHYDYTGVVTSTTESYSSVENLEYSYPYFSDEWSAVALTKYSIDSGKLPLKNPLWHNVRFPNFEFAFHSFASELIVLFDLDPVTQYPVLSLFFGLIICLLVYFLLRFNGIGKFGSAIAALSLIYIVNGANLPGLWTFIPLIMGLICMLLGLIFISVNDKKAVLGISVLILLFYPPLFVIFSGALLFYLGFKNKRSFKKNFLFYLLVCIGVTILLAGFVLLAGLEISSLFSLIFSKLFYETFTTGAIPDFSIWKVVPVLSLFFFFWGVIRVWKEKKYWFIVSVVLGLVFWVVYSFVTKRIIIEYERVVLTTSVLVIFISGFGIDSFFKVVQNVLGEKFRIIIFILIMLVFLIGSFSYTQREDWKELKLEFVSTGEMLEPASPANVYLNKDDLKLFEGISEKRFLSHPWKGLVIGVSTSNYPLETKTST